MRGEGCHESKRAVLAPFRLQHLGEWVLNLDWAAQWSWLWRHGVWVSHREVVRAGELTLPKAALNGLARAML